MGFNSAFEGLKAVPTLNFKIFEPTFLYIGTINNLVNGSY